VFVKLNSWACRKCKTNAELLIGIETKTWPESSQGYRFLVFIVLISKLFSSKEEKCYVKSLD
jgi:hypothetical protein